MKYADLPAALKAQVDAKLDKTSTKRTSQRVARAGTTTRWRCAACGKRFTAESGPNGWKDHKHRRIECVL